MSLLPPPTTPPAGWYPDPTGVGSRYFDGRTWAPTAPVFEERPPHPDLPLMAAVGALVVLVASLVVARAVAAALDAAGAPWLVYAITIASLGYGPSLVWVWYVRRRWAGGQFSALGWQFRWSDLGWGPLTYLAALGTQIAIGAVVYVFDIPLTSNVEDVSDLTIDRAYVIATILTTVIAAPIIEELVFRGVVIRGLLSRLGAVAAIVLQGILFGAAHVDATRGAGNIGLAMVLSGVGIALGCAAYLTRRLGACIIAHGILNGIVMTLVLTGVADDLQDDIGRLAGLTGQLVRHAIAG